MIRMVLNMSRYKHVNYKHAAWMCRMAVIKEGKDMRLKDVVRSLSIHEGLCLDPREIMKALGDRCKTVVEDVEGVRRECVWVRYS